MNNIKKYKTYSGSDAVVLGALKAGASFFSGYPITPSSDIMHEWVKRAQGGKKGLKFLQMEDEVGAIHAVLGAALAGKKAFTATSGPGFSLMQEGLALGFAMEVPLVVVNCQRQGPATGMPTIGSQGDILQTQYGPHGDYCAIVFCPNSIKEMYELTIHAFNASQECNSPVILLTEGYLANLREQEDLEKIKVEIKNTKLKPLTKDNHARHFSGLTQNEDGVETFEAETYRKWIETRREKIQSVGKRYGFFEFIQNKKAKSKNLLISYGITSRIAEEIAKEEGFDHFRPKTLFPMNEKFLKKISNDYENITVVEMNEGQYAGKIQETILKKVKRVRVIGAEPKKGDVLKNIKKVLRNF